MACFENRASLSVRRTGALEAVARRQHMLHEVVQWMAAQNPAPRLARIVDQDEFTNDVVLELEDCWLSYDCS